MQSCKGSLIEGAMSQKGDVLNKKKCQQQLSAWLSGSPSYYRFWKFNCTAQKWQCSAMGVLLQHFP